MEWRNFMAVWGCWRHERCGKSHRGFAQIHHLCDVEVERTGRNANIERVFVELLQETLGVDLPSGLESAEKALSIPPLLTALRRQSGERRVVA